MPQIIVKITIVIHSFLIVVPIPLKPFPSINIFIINLNNKNTQKIFNNLIFAYKKFNQKGYEIYTNKKNDPYSYTHTYR